MEEFDGENRIPGVSADTYDEFCRVARRILGDGNYPKSFTLSARDAVDDALIKLSEIPDLASMPRSRFKALVAKAVRQVICDYARRRTTQKRGGGQEGDDIESYTVDFVHRAVLVLDLDEALTKLAEARPVQAQVVELHFFGGMTHDEIAEALGISESWSQKNLKSALATLLVALEGYAHA